MTTKQAIARAKVAGKAAARRFVAFADAELVKQGKAARARQRKRTARKVLKKVARTLVAAGTAAAAIIATRAARRAVRRTAPKP